ncbi:MAG TPA: radical SAM protein [Chitinophagaceae bacterium]|nr:radical SAM protein [Chitinophagaceae bacterium]
MIAYKEVKSILNKHKKRDSWFLDDYSVNPYEGCGFNCTYCYVHGSKYGENLAEKIVIKKDAADILDRQLNNRARKDEFGFITLGSGTDAYMQVEEQIGLTREFLKIILKHRFPVFISTKSALIKRDLDLLKQIDETAILPEDLKQNPGRGVIISFSFSTLDEKIANQIEAGAPAPQERLETLKLCSDNGFLCGVNAMPLLPFITDTDEELEKIIAAAKQYGANFIFIAGLTLFGNDERDSKQLVFKFLRNHYPHLIEKYEEMYGSVHYPSWQYQQQLKRRGDVLCEKYEIKNSIR